MALRFDIGTLKPAKVLPDGRVRAEAYISRAGIQEYMDDRGRVRRELRPVEEVGDPQSLGSFSQVPVTNDHPDVGNLSAATARRYMVGSTGERVEMHPDPAGLGQDHVKTSIMVADAATIEQMRAGKLETSCGYTCDLDERPGVHPVWGPYDAVQRRIRGNHVAIVDSARAGRTVRVRMDGASFQRADRTPPARSQSMDPDKLQEVIRSLNAQLEEARKSLSEQTARADAAEKRADTEHGRVLQIETTVSDLQARIDAGATAVESEAVAREKQRADDAEARVARFDSTMETRVRERCELVRQAYVVMGDDFRTEDLSDREIREAVVKRLDSNADVGKGVSDGIVTGRYLALVEGHAVSARSHARVAEVIAAGQKEAPRADARQQRKAAARDLWKQPLPNDLRARKEN